MTIAGAGGRVVERFWALAEDPARGIDVRLESAFIAARALTRCYYAGVLLLAFMHLAEWDYYTGLRAIQPLWPVAWASGSDGLAARIVLLLFVGGSLLAALFPDRLAARAAAFAGCLEFYAFVSSFGAVRHVHHLLLLTTFLFVLLPPAGSGDETSRRAYLRAFWGVQCGALLTYSMSGFLKLATGLWHLASGRGGLLTPPALALHVANSAIRFGVDPLLAGPAIGAGGLGLPLYLAVIYLELFALVAAFRPRLHRPWGAALLILHVAIGLTLNLFFVSTVFIIGVLFLSSPFAPASGDLRHTLRDVPLLGRLVPATTSRSGRP